MITLSVTRPVRPYMSPCKAADKKAPSLNQHMKKCLRKQYPYYVSRDEASLRVSTRYPSSALIHVTCVTRIRLQRPLLTHRINSRTHFTGILTQAALSRWRLLSVGFITCYSFRSMSLPCTLYHMRKHGICQLDFKSYFHLKQICLCFNLKSSFLQFYEALHDRKSKPRSFRIPRRIPAHETLR